MDKKRKPTKGKRPRRKRGQPRKLQPSNVRNRLLGMVRDGVSFNIACDALGVVYQTLRNECQRDPDFEAQVEQAKADRIVSLTAIVYGHALKDPRTAVHLLACLDRTYAKQDATQTHVHAHAHAEVPPRVIFEIIDKRLGTGADPPASSPDASGVFEQ